MRLLIERSELLRTLGHVASVVERRTTIPILSNVLMHANAGALELKGTDLEREVTESAPADIAQPGAVTVSAHLLYDIVRKLPDGSQISIDSDGSGRLTLASRHSRFYLPVLSADEFPDLAAGEMSHSFEVGAGDLKRLIEKTRFAISTEETRYYLNGIYFHAARSASDAAVLRAVATDGHRLAQVELPLPDGAEGIPGIIIPRKTVHELHRLIEDLDTPVTVALSNTKIQFTTGSVIMTSKLIDGTFPDYQRVIPKSNDKTMDVAKADFAMAVDRVSTVSTDRGRAVKLNITPDKLILSVTNPDGGSATEEVPISYDADGLEIGFNARYLLDIAGQLESETVHFMLADPGSPTTVRDGDDTSALYVLMPMRV